MPLASRTIIRLASATLLLSCLTANSRADFVVSIGNTSIAAGGTGTVDVLIRSTNAAGDPLSSFGFEFVITSGTTRHLDFRNPQLDSQLTLGTYVFAGNSGDATGGIPVGVVSSSGGGTNNRFVGGDDTNSGVDVTVTTNRLLARLDLTAATSSPPVTGDAFTIALIPSAFTDFRDSRNTVIPFTSVAGTITITAPPVPEPAASALLLTGIAVALGYRRLPSRPARPGRS